MSISETDKFIRNAWYIIGWSEEIDDGKILSRKIIGNSIAVYRQEDGTPAALSDRCPHRFAPLSTGTIVGDNLRCPYHGLEFAPDGHCARNPQGHAPSAARVRSFPMHDQDGILWVWTGEPEKADVAVIPRYERRNDPNYRYINGYTLVKAHYQLAIDNLLDLSHIAFLHPGLGGDTYQPKNTVTAEADSVCSHYLLEDYPANPYSEAFYPELGSGQISEENIMSWNAPAALRLDIRVAHVGELDREDVKAICDAHILAPESAGTTHYFWSTCFPRSVTASDETIIEILSTAFDKEDKPMLERVQAAMDGDEFWSLKPILLRDDNAAVRARRIIDRRLVEEQAVQIHE